MLQCSRGTNGSAIIKRTVACKQLVAQCLPMQCDASRYLASCSEGLLTRFTLDWTPPCTWCRGGRNAVMSQLSQKPLRIKHMAHHTNHFKRLLDSFYQLRLHYLERLYTGWRVCRPPLWVGCMCAWLVPACSCALLVLWAASILSTALHAATHLELHSSRRTETCKLRCWLASPSGTPRLLQVVCTACTGHLCLLSTRLSTDLPSCCCQLAHPRQLQRRDAKIVNASYT